MSDTQTPMERREGSFNRALDELNRRYDGRTFQEILVVREVSDVVDFEAVVGRIVTAAKESHDCLGAICKTGEARLCDVITATLLLGAELRERRLL